MRNSVPRLFLAMVLTAVIPAAGIALHQQNGAPDSKDKNGDVGKKPTDSTQNKSVTLKGDQAVQLNVDLVSVTVTVTDSYGRFVTGLAKDQFEVYDDKIKQEIAHFSDEDAPVSLGIVYDVSGSMKERIHRSMQALKRFIETSHDDDDFFLMAFNNRANLV